MTAVLSRPGFRALFVGQAVSALGDWMLTVALLVLVARVSDSTAAVGGVLVLRLLPAMLAGSATARLIRRWDRRRTMITMDLVRAGLVLLVPLVRGLWWIYLLAFLLELCGLIFLPARDASIPDLVDDEHEGQTAAANGLVLAASFGTIPFGAGVFALVTALGNTGGGRLPYFPVFVIDAVTFLVSAVFLRRVTELRRPVEATRPAQEGSDLLRARRVPLVRTTLPAALVVALGVGSLFSLGVRLVREVLGATDAEFGALIVLFGVGAVAGLTLTLRPERLTVEHVRAGAIAQGVTIAVMSQAPNLALTFAGAVLYGASAAFTLAAGMSYLQHELDGDARVLAFSAFHSVVRGGLAVAALVAGAAADLLDPIDLPWDGSLDPARLVLGVAGLVVVAGALSISDGRRHRR